MVRLTALALIVVLIFIQLSSIECKKKKEKGCKFNGETLKAEEKISYIDMCVDLVCRKAKRKGGKERKKGGGGKKYAMEAEAIKFCFPTKCKDLECGGPCMPPCGIVKGRCTPPQPNITDCPTICPANYAPVCGTDCKTYSNECALSVASCQKPNDNIAVAYDGECLTESNSQNEKEECEESSSTCPTEWECKTEKYTDTETGCTKCRCSSEDPQYEEFCGPVQCPMDCGIIYIVNANTGCKECKCDPGDFDNPFEPPGSKPTISAVRSRDWLHPDGCNTCTCMNGMAACTEMACLEEKESDDSSICKTGCSKEMMLVCGSDGITYENSCLIDLARICKGTNVTVSHTGSCAGTMKCQPCNKRKWAPVCGDDGKTYSNACMLEFSNCKNGKNVMQVKDGECEDGGKDQTMKCKPCNKRMMHHVCGDDGKTYSNACMLDFENCQKGKDVKLVKEGKCEGDKKRNMKKPKRDNHRTKERKIVQSRKKGKKGKCTYNGKKVKANKVKDLGVHCTQLKCTKVGNSVKLEMQYNPKCEC